MLRILNTQQHWAFAVVRRGQTPDLCEMVVFDGLFELEIMDMAWSIRTYLLELWFGAGADADQEACAPMWGRVAGQAESWTCGHRVVLCLEALVEEGAFDFEGDTPKVAFSEVFLGQEWFECFERERQFNVFVEHFWGEDEDPDEKSTPQTPKQRKRPSPPSQSPAAVIPPKKRLRAKTPVHDGWLSDREDADTLADLLASASCRGESYRELVNVQLVLYGFGPKKQLAMKYVIMHLKSFKHTTDYSCKD